MEDKKVLVELVKALVFELEQDYVFITSRQKIHPDGEKLLVEILTYAKEVLESLDQQDALDPGPRHN